MYGLISASGRSSYFRDGRSFLSCPYHPFKYVFSVLVPNTGTIKSWFDTFFLPNQKGAIYYDGYNTRFLFMGGFLIFVMVYLTRVAISKETGQEKERFYSMAGVACLWAVFFWILYIGGESFILAGILAHFPVIKGFRFLYKAIYVIPSLLVLPASIGLSKVCGFKVKWKIAIYAVCFICLAEQVYECKSAIAEPYIEYDYEYLQEIEGFEKNNYRVLFLTADEDNHEIIDCMPYANANVTAGIQTIGGFELTCGKLPESMKTLYAGVEWVGLSGSNAVQKSDLLNYFDEDRENLRKFILALDENSVGYIMTRNADLDDIFRKMEEYGYLTEIIYHNDQNQVEIYKIKNVVPLATDETGKQIDITKLDLDQFEMLTGGESKKIKLNIRYNKNLHAYFTDYNGDRYDADIQQNGNGVQVNLPSSEGVLIIKYENKIYSMGIFLAIVYLPLIAGAVIFAVLKTRNTGKNSQETDERE